MSTIAEIEIPAAEFALRETLQSRDDVVLEMERVVAHSKDRVMPFVWATGDDLEAIDAEIHRDSSVENVELIASFDDERLYRMDWVRDTRVVIHLLLDQGATILSSSGRDTRWRLRILFPDRKSLSATHEFCSDNDLTLHARSIYKLDASHRAQFGLTEEQRETLVTAAEHGYYGVPRAKTMDELATILGVSHQALSERLRRGHKNLVENALLVGTHEDEEDEATK